MYLDVTCWLGHREQLPPVSRSPRLSHPSTFGSVFTAVEWVHEPSPAVTCSAPAKPLAPSTAVYNAAVARLYCFSSPSLPIFILLVV